MKIFEDLYFREVTKLTEWEWNFTFQFTKIQALCMRNPRKVNCLNGSVKPYLPASRLHQNSTKKLTHAHNINSILVDANFLWRVIWYFKVIVRIFNLTYLDSGPSSGLYLLTHSDFDPSFFHIVVKLRNQNPNCQVFRVSSRFFKTKQVIVDVIWRNKEMKHALHQIKIKKNNEGINRDIKSIRYGNHLKKTE